VRGGTDLRIGEEERKEEVHEACWFCKRRFYDGSNDGSTRSSICNDDIRSTSNCHLDATAKKLVSQS
jgi:hypothetical protein